MGNTKGLYKEEFPKRSMVRIADRAFLTNFLQTWELHNKLEPDQLNPVIIVAVTNASQFARAGFRRCQLAGKSSHADIELVLASRTTAGCATHPRRLAASTRYRETEKASEAADCHACHSIQRLRTLILHYASRNNQSVVRCRNTGNEILEDERNDSRTLVRSSAAGPGTIRSCAWWIASPRDR